MADCKTTYKHKNTRAPLTASLQFCPSAPCANDGITIFRFTGGLAPATLGVVGIESRGAGEHPSYELLPPLVRSVLIAA